jgi:tetratricopeptide (TPR) repeat protein
MRPAGGAVMTALLVAGCAPALREPPPVSVLAKSSGSGRSADELVRAADAAWARRADPRAAEEAEQLYLEAAAADERRVDGLLGAMRALTRRIERERDASVRARLSEQEVQLGQWCGRRAPDEPACPYRLAIALGQQARERSSTGKDAMGKMVELLRKAKSAAPSLDSAGPQRVLALLLLRAPAWPVGPGDPDAALEEARAAVKLFPDVADNQLVLAEALDQAGSVEEARAACQRAVQLATAAAEAGDPDAPKVRADAAARLEKLRAPK